jgi:hypothetical protein
VGSVSWRASFVDALVMAGFRLRDAGCRLRLGCTKPRNYLRPTLNITIVPL